MGWSNQGPVRLGLVLLLAAVTIDAREYKISCHGSAGHILKYEPGKVYSYKLEGSSVTKLVGAIGDQSKVGITADVKVAVLSSCEHVLKVTNVQVSGPDAKKYNLNKLSQQPIKFGLQNGRIEGQLLANAAEDSVGLNIKRAVLSLIQSAALKENGYATQLETDISGTCPTAFEFSKSGNSIIVRKTRDLVKCAYREEISVPYLTTPYYVKSDIQSSPLLASTLTGEQKIERGILTSASREEHYEYRPVASEATAKVHVKTTLKYVSASPGSIPATCTEPRSIIFEKEHDIENKGAASHIVDLVRQGCDSRIVGQDTALQFSKLVRAVASASKQDIISALQQINSGSAIKDKQTAQRMLKDAIVMAQSASSVEVMADILKKKEVTGETAKLWLLGLGAVKHASRSSLMAVLPLLDGEPDINAYLGIGSLAGKFCKEHKCEGVNEINQLQIKLGAPLLKGCKCNSKREENQLIASLKGLGNIKYLGPKIAGKIIECAEDTNVRPRIRAAALETIRTDPNKDEFKNFALNILKNVNEDSELRIKAYLILAQCPCGKVASAIKELLSKEQSNQVGGFIVSHLRNLQASTNPDKRHALHYLGNIIPPRRFTIDPRRFSINQELSYFADIVNSGAAGEANIIYSQNSYLPRSLSLNLTVQLFGTAYNLFEVDTRAENLENIAERMFGPTGYLRTNEVEDVVEDSKHQLSNIFEMIASRYEQSLRPKRSISRDRLNAIANKVHLPKGSDDIDLDVSLKVLGSEVLWKHLHGSDARRIDLEDVVDDYFGSVDKLIDSLKNADIDYRRHINFLDHELTYPTSLGLPLKLKTTGSAALRVKLDGKFDLPATIRDPQNANVMVQLLPSAAVNVAGELLIDAGAFEAGARVDLNVHTSTGSDITFRLLSGRGVDIKLGMPIAKQEVLSVKVDMTSVVRDDAQVVTASPVKYETKRESYSGCFDQLNPLIGLTFCGEVSVPYEEGKPIYPIYGPVNLALRIEKEDPSLSAYHIKALYEKNEETKVHSAELLLDTPNSSTNRKLSFKVEGSIHNPKRYLDVSVNTPWTNVDLNAHLVNTDKEKSINAKLVYDQAEYVAHVGLGLSPSGNKVTYVPIFEYKAPEGSKSALIGKKGGQKPKQQAVSCSGSITEEVSGKRRSYKFNDLTISTPRTKYVLAGTVSVQPQQGSTDLKITYDKEHVTIHGKLDSDGKEEYHTELAVASTQFPDFGVNLKYDLILDKPPVKYDSKLIIIHGPDPKSTVSRLYLHDRHEKVVEDGHIRLFKAHHEISYPVLNLEVIAKMGYTPKSLLAGFSGKFDKYSAKFEGGGEIDHKNAGDYKIDLEGHVMGSGIQVESSRSIEGKDKSRIKNTITFKPGGLVYEVNALVVHKLTETETDLQLDAEASVPNQPPVKLVAGLLSSGNKNKGHVKLNFGDKCLLEGSSALDTTTTPQGNYKLVLTGYLESEGKLSTDKSNRKAVATIYLPKADRKIEIKSDVTLTSSKLSGDMSICYDTKDPSKTIRIKTENTFSNDDNDSSLDSRNTLSHGDSELKVNIKESMKGTSSYGELEVILPNKYKFGGKYTDSHNLVGEKGEGEVVLELYDEGEGLPLQKLKLSAVGKHISITEQTIDGQAQLSYTSRDGKNSNLHVNLKKLPNSNGKTSTINGEIGASGDLLEDPVNLKFESEISNEYFDPDDSSSAELEFPLLTYKTTVSIGDDISFDAAGKLNGPTISNQLSAKLPDSAPIKSFKIVSNNLIDLSEDSKEHSKIKLNNAVHWNDNKHVKINVEGICEGDGVQYVVEFETDSISKRRAAGSVHFSGEEGKADASINLSYDGKTADLSGKIEVNDEKNAANVHLLSNIPGKGKVDIVYRQKVVKDGRGFHADITVSTKDKQMSGNVKIELDPDHPVVELNFDQPEGKSRFLYKYDKKGERHFASELKAKWSTNPGWSIAVDTDANLASMDNFYVKVNFESPGYKWKKGHLDITNKPTKGEAQKITFSLKSNDKTIFSGSANYNYKEEGDLAVLEGNGNIKIDDKNYPLTFQASQRSISENDQQAKFNLKAGKMSVNVETKANPNELFWERVICYDTKECSKALIDIKVQEKSIETYEHSVTVILDFSLLNNVFDGNFHDVTYKSHYKQDVLLSDHSIEIQWAKDGRLKYHAYVHEHAAGLYLTLPKRTIGGELKYEILRKKENIASMKFEAGLDLNKGKEPKWVLVAGTTAQYDKGVAILAGESKVSHPTLSKDLVVKGQVQISDKPSKLLDALFEVDLTKNPNGKLVGKVKVTGSLENHVILVHLKNKECGLDFRFEDRRRTGVTGKDCGLYYNADISYLDSKGTKHDISVKLEATPRKLELVFNDPETAVLNLDYRLDRGYEGKLNIFGRKYTETLFIDKDTKHLKYQLSGLEGGKKLEIEAGYRIGYNGVLRASLNGKRACNLDVALDETNFLQSKYSYDVEVAKSIYGALSNEVKVLAVEGEKSLSNLIEKKTEDAKHILHCVTKLLPDPEKAGEYFKTQINEIRDEIANDETVVEASKFLKEVTGDFGEQVISIAEELHRFVISMGKLLKQTIEQVRASVNEVLPKIKPNIQRITKALNGLLEQYIKLSVQILDLIANKIKEHETDIKHIADATLGYVQEIGKLVGKVVIAINSELEKLIEQTIETIRGLPVFVDLEESLKEFKDLQIPEEIFNIYRELIEVVKQIIPTPEVNQFLDTLTNVVEKILKQEKIPNKEGVVRQLYKELVEAIKSIIALIAQNTPEIGFSKPSKLQTSSLPSHLLRLPSGGASFSLLNFLANKQSLPGLNEILAGLKLSLNPIDYIPPYHGIGGIVGGTEIITFDGLHMNIQGTCSYVLSEDYRDRNFSVVGQIKNGALQSITLISGKDSIEILSSGKLVVNGQASTFPAHTGELWAWRRPENVGVASKAGVYFICSPNLDNCAVEVSGFYFGKLRGLLGNLNGETYDERMTPEGKIVESSGELANSWKLDGSCAPCPTGQHKHNRVSVCTDIFADDPLALICRPFVNPAPFRDACDDLASRSNNKEEAACIVSRAYTYACRRRGVFLAMVPDQCASCKINGKELDAYDNVKVKPGKAADIVVVADLIKDNEPNFKEVALPIIEALKSQLGKNGISDVRVALVGGNSPKSRYHNYYWNKQGELADPASVNLHFVERKPVNNETAVGRLESILNVILLETGSYSRTRMYQDVLKENLFRPDALKAIVGVQGSPCTGPTLGTTFLIVRRALQLEFKDISYNLIAPFEEKIGDGEIAVLNEKESVLSDGKKITEHDYSYDDMCVTLAFETNGNAINPDRVRSSPNKAQLIEVAAEKIASSILERNNELLCSCDLNDGIVPQPYCLSLD